MTAPCPRCDGCGQIADTEDGEPWIAWTSLPPGSDLAVRLGQIRPIPCPDCTPAPLEDGWCRCCGRTGEHPITDCRASLAAAPAFQSVMGAPVTEDQITRPGATP